MALTKREFTEKEFVGEFQHCNFNTVTVIEEDGLEISRTSHRQTCMCGNDVKAAALDIDVLTNILWTQQIRDDYTAFVAAKLEKP